MDPCSKVGYPFTTSAPDSGDDGGVPGDPGDEGLLLLRSVSCCVKVSSSVSARGGHGRGCGDVSATYMFSNMSVTKIYYTVVFNDVLCETEHCVTHPQHGFCTL